MSTTPNSLAPQWQQVLNLDPVMAGLIRSGKEIIQEPQEDIYLTLLSSIISQQLSTKVARVIEGRFLNLFPGQYPLPELVLALPDETLRNVGLSFQKLGYIRNVADFAQQGHLDYRLVAELPDEELIGHLVRIKGVGRWTAEMILMFALVRPDVFPVDDLGIQNAMRKHYGLSATGKSLLAEMIRIAEAWRPHRTLACLYLWQSLENTPI